MNKNIAVLGTTGALVLLLFLVVEAQSDAGFIVTVRNVENPSVHEGTNVVVTTDVATLTLYDVESEPGKVTTGFVAGDRDRVDCGRAGTERQALDRHRDRCPVLTPTPTQSPVPSPTATEEVQPTETPVITATPTMTITLPPENSTSTPTPTPTLVLTEPVRLPTETPTSIPTETPTSIPTETVTRKPHRDPTSTPTSPPSPTATDADTCTDDDCTQGRRLPATGGSPTSLWLPYVVVGLCLIFVGSRLRRM